MANLPSDLYADITNTIIKAIEQKAYCYEMPWHRGASARWPINAYTKKRYSGINVVTLWASATNEGYPTDSWATYRQWQMLDAQVRKGEKSSPVVFYKPIEQTDAATKERPRYVARASRVFNRAQVNGYFEPEPKPATLVEMVAHAEHFIAATNADIVHRGDSACYRHEQDAIFMPERNRFVGTSTSTPTESYYAVLLHELTHWTGHSSRLSRPLASDDTKVYAMEELIAEIGAAYLCADLAITNEPRPDHAAYVGNWLEIMKGDSRAIISASREAVRATRFLAHLQNPEGGQPLTDQEDHDVPF